MENKRRGKKGKRKAVGEAEGRIQGKGREMQEEGDTEEGRRRRREGGGAG